MLVFLRNLLLEWANTLHCCTPATMITAMQSTRWWDYITEIIGDSTYSQAATKAGFDKSAFTRWKKGARADPDFVVKIARAYDANVLEALVAAEFITEAEAKLREIKVGGITLNDATNEQLTDEILRRLQADATAYDATVDELAIRRSKAESTPADKYDGTVCDWDDTIPHAADSSPDENEERLKRGEDPID